MFLMNNRIIGAITCLILISASLVPSVSFSQESGSVDNHVINVKEIREERLENFPGFSHKADNYLQFAPVPAVFLMDALGYKAAHTIPDQLIYFGQAELIMMSMVYPMKMLTKVPRPDYSSNNSFPSGHTAQAFVASQFFQKEFGRRSPWLS